MSGVDDMDDLKRLLAGSPAPAPDPAARARALAAARTAFDAEGAAAADLAARAKDEKIAANLQGTTDGTRQRNRQTGLMTLIRRRLMNMSLPSTRQMMMGGASLAVLAIAVFAVQNQDLRFGPQRAGDVPAPAISDGKDRAGNEAARAPANKTADLNAAGETERTRADTAPEPAKVPADTLTRTEPGRVGTIGDDRKPEADTSADAPVDREARTGRLDAPEAPAATGGSVPALRDADEAAAPPPPVVAEEKAAADDAPASLATGNRNRLAPGRGQEKPAAERRANGFTSNGPADGAIVGQLRGGAAAKGDVEMKPKAPSRALPLAVPEAEPAPADSYKETGRDRFPDVEQNQVKLVSEEPVSTFSVDVDTASYAFMRKALANNVLPAKDSIRIEELINYFPYDYRAPENRETPFSANVTVMDTPWNAGTKLMRIGIKGYEIKAAEKPRSNLVFLIDTSGSMNAPDKLPLLIQSFEMLLDTLGADDTVSIVAYAGSAGTVLEPTRASDKAKIRAALNRLSAGGSTAGGEGIRLAYDLAQANFDKGGVNRVILATDGDFNVGIRNTQDLQGFIERKRDTGVFLSVLGFGRGNYNDALMQTLAQNGNGQAAYIDTLGEARKVLVDEASSTLFPIAKDVKIQVDFNPNVVAEYRLIGYETRALNREDFNNDKIDAAEIGAGHSVTALYEITPVGSDARLVDPSRYERPAADAAGTADEYAFVKIRYKDPDADTSKLITRPVTKADETTPDDDARFAAAVAAFGQLLKGGRYTGTFTFDDVIALASGARGADPYNYRGEFVQLVRQAKTARAMERQ